MGRALDLEFCAVNLAYPDFGLFSKMETVPVSFTFDTLSIKFCTSKENIPQQIVLHSIKEHLKNSRGLLQAG